MNQLFNSVYVANEANAKPEMLMMSLLANADRKSVV